MLNLTNDNAIRHYMRQQEVNSCSNMEKKEKGKAIIVGGSIAGISCAHALLRAGWDVVVLEKAGGPPTGSPTGAGLGLDRPAQRIIQSWLNGHPHLLHLATVPLTIDQV